jgi:hypothetical protein
MKIGEKKVSFELNVAHLLVDHPKKFQNPGLIIKQ